MFCRSIISILENAIRLSIPCNIIVFLQVTLPKPLGIVFEESQWRDGNGKCRVVVAGLVPGGNADRASRVAKLFHGGSKLTRNQNQPVFDGDVRPGDILRATTTVNALTLEKHNRSWD